MTDEQKRRVEEIAEREKNATPPEWSIPHFATPEVGCKCGYILVDGYCGAVATVHFSGDRKLENGDNPPLEEAVANAHFISHSRADIPYLLTVIAEQEARCAELEEALRPAFNLLVAITVEPLTGRYCGHKANLGHPIDWVLTRDAKTVADHLSMRDCGFVSLLALTQFRKPEDY